MSDLESRLTRLVAELTLERKVLLLTGQDFWTTWPLDEIGLRSLVFSDGPSGVRGVVWDERDPSLSLPSSTALAATWDRELAHRYGAALAVEARRKDVDVVLGPTINLHRSPLGGRHFEAFSEDPALTGEIAAAYVKGLQANGIAATPKHYVANEAETERFTASSVVSERALHELYLEPFRRAVVDGRAWSLMSAYNSINGVTASENALLEDPLRTDWDFDGMVVSDWTAVRSIAAANAEQDLAMPGPTGAWGAALVDAVRDGRVSEVAIDRKVVRILRLAQRVGALDGLEREVAEPVLVEDGRDLARSIEVAGAVLVQNDGILPLEPRSVQRIAVIGHSASIPRIMGGGSATVIPERTSSPLDAIKLAYPDAEVTYSIGAIVQAGLEGIPAIQLHNPRTGTAGVHVSFFDVSGTEIYAEERMASQLVWLGSGAPIERVSTTVLETTWTPKTTGVVQFGIAATGTATLLVDGVEVWQTTLAASGDDLAMALLSPRMDSHALSVEAGREYALRIEFERVLASAAADNAMSFSFGLAPAVVASEALLSEAETAASTADVVVLVVGTNSEVESEGFDRVDLSLPGNQDVLAERVLAANPRTIVVVNSGSPVVLPWRARAAAILLGWFGGQEFGSALADVISGTAEPGGRLPTTWPAALDDVPVLNVTPQSGALEYAEGIHVGYRAWLKSGRTPAWAFGHGLGYSRWGLNSISTPRSVTPGGEVLVDVSLTNEGSRASKQVVQVYASRPNSSVDRPLRWLVGFESVWARAGETTGVRIAIPASSFAHWADGGWAYEAGSFTVAAGFSLGSITGACEIEMVAAPRA